MIEVANQIVFARVVDILYRVKRETGYLRDIKLNGDKALITCPCHSNGNENSPSCIINFNKTDKFEAGSFHCFSCHETGSLANLIGRCFHENEIWGTKWILENYGGSEIQNRGSMIKVPMRVKTQEVACKDDLDSYRYIHPYMYKRHLTDDIINMFDIGYDGKNITFPIKDVSGKVLFVAKRSVSGKKFYIPPNVEKPLCYLYEAQKHFPNSQEIYVVESLFNALTLYKYGYPAIALLGTGTKEQIEMLEELPYRRIIVALDNDAAGDVGYLKIRDKIRDKFVIRLKLKEHGKDINDFGDLALEDFRECIHIS